MNARTARSQVELRVRGRVPRQVAVAMQAVERGWPVFPLRAGGKLPAIRSAHPKGDPARGTCRGECGRLGHGCYDATLDKRWVQEWPGWVTGNDNVGIATGPAGLLVVDLDAAKPLAGSLTERPPDEWALQGIGDGADVYAVLAEQAGATFPWPGSPDATHTVTTARGGSHLYYAHPTSGETVIRLGNTAGDGGRGLGWHVDTRGHGGYVVAAGSMVDGQPYTTTLNMTATPLPGWVATALLALADPVNVPAGTPPLDLERGVRRPAAYAHTALERGVQEILEATAHATGGSGRNDTLNRVAWRLGRVVAAGLLPDTLVIDALSAAAHAVGLDSIESSRTIESGLSAGARRPLRSTHG
jgi:hypothetical protein